VVLVSDPGGSGAFYDLAAVVERNGELMNVDIALLGDRVQINSLAIQHDLGSFDICASIGGRRDTIVRVPSIVDGHR
jgi:hypothetical protein